MDLPDHQLEMLFPEPETGRLFVPQDAPLNKAKGIRLFKELREEIIFRNKKREEMLDARHKDTPQVP